MICFLLSYLHPYPEIQIIGIQNYSLRFGRKNNKDSLAYPTTHNTTNNDRIEYLVSI